MKRRLLQIIGAVLVVAGLLGGAALGAVLWRIQQSVRQCRQAAQQAHPHPGDDVAALVEFMKSDLHSWRNRNLAVWTLGRLGDARARPALEGAYTGEPCAHERKLCQYELEKAIRRCGGSPSPPGESGH